jgi:hypothetical protein
MYTVKSKQGSKSVQLKFDLLYAWTDGGSRGNPGNSGAGVVISFDKSVHISGVYAIFNIETSSVYIGSSVNIARRWLKHIRQLRAGTHDNSYLQRSWDKYGEGNFAFVVIQAVPKDQLEVREQHYLDQVFGHQACFNMAKVVNSPNKGLKLTEQHRRKIGVANAVSLRGKHLTEEQKKKISESMKGKNVGKTLSPEHRAKLSEAHKGMRCPWNSYPRTEETKRKISAAKLGVKHAQVAHV